MPSFTLELFRVIESKPDDVAEDTWLGLNEYPLFDSTYRNALNKKIKDHFMFQEIGHETVDQFRFAMRRKMNEIMPLYNQLYESARLEFDPLKTVDIRTITEGISEQTSTGETESNTSSDIDAVAKNVASNFPQVMLRGNADYASSGADSNSQTETVGTASENSTASNNATQESDSRTTGFQGSQAALIMEARSLFLNVDMQVIAELDELFMLVWNNGDEYTRSKGRFFY